MFLGITLKNISILMENFISDKKISNSAEIIHKNKRIAQYRNKSMQSDTKTETCTIYSPV